MINRPCDQGLGSAIILRGMSVGHMFMAGGEAKRVPDTGPTSRYPQLSIELIACVTPISE